MSKLREAAQQALECLDGVSRGDYDGNAAVVIVALRDALAQAESEPEPWMGISDNPYVNDHDCNDPNGRAMRWHDKLQTILESNATNIEQMVGTHLRLRNFAEDWAATGMEEYDDSPLASPEPFGWLYESKAGVRIFHCVSDNKPLVQADWEAVQQYPEAHKMTPLYLHPSQRKPLTNGEICTAYITATNQTLRAQDEKLALEFARAIEQAHGIEGDT